jgi:hypothetical protein
MEELHADSKRLNFYNKNIKPEFQRNIDEMHLQFLCENQEIVDVNDLCLVKKVFDFLKTRA